MTNRHIHSWDEIQSLRVSVPLGDPELCANLLSRCPAFDKAAFLAALDELSGELEAEGAGNMTMYRYRHDMEICSGALAAARGGLGVDPGEPFVMRDVQPLRANRIWSIDEGVTISLGKHAGLTTFHFAGDRKSIVAHINSLLKTRREELSGAAPDAFSRDLNACAKFWKGNTL